MVKQESFQERLHRELGSVSGVQIKNDEGTLVVRYRTEMVKVRLQNKSGVLSKPIVQERPKLTGFKLETYDFDHKSTDPQRPEQAVRMNPQFLRDYGTWKMDAVERQIDNQEKARYYYLIWGSNVDKKLLTRVRAALEAGTHPLKEF